MMNQSTWGQTPWYRIGFAFAAVGIGAILGAMVIWLDSPLLAVAGLVGLLFAVFAALNVEVALLALISITFVRLSDVLMKDYGLPSIAKPFIALMIIGVVLRWLFYSRPPRGWLRAAVLVGIWGVMVFASLIYAADFRRIPGIRVETY